MILLTNIDAFTVIEANVCGQTVPREFLTKKKFSQNPFGQESRIQDSKDSIFGLALTLASLSWAHLFGTRQHEFNLSIVEKFTFVYISHR